jgi:hypothetical protein
MWRGDIKVVQRLMARFKRIWGNDLTREAGGRLVFTFDLAEAPPPEAAETQAEARP